MLQSFQDILQDAVAAFFTIWNQAGGLQSLFLPRGKGASILILGGIAMLGFSLSMALQTAPEPRSSRDTRRAPDERSSRQATGGGSQARAGMRPRPSWLTAAIETAIEAGMEPPRRLRIDPSSHVLGIPSCARSTDPGAFTTGCEEARELLERGLRSHLGYGRVVTVACNAGRDEPCVLEVRTEASFA